MNNLIWYVYILYSESINRYYVGSTSNLVWRLERHNLGWGKYTKNGIPWILVYSEQFETKSLASKREREIKRKKSRIYIESLLEK
ncbi:MAG: GIY-YIG nuclease family protein [Calditrichaceae bacterium]